MEPGIISKAPKFAILSTKATPRHADRIYLEL